MNQVKFPLTVVHIRPLTLGLAWQGRAWRREGSHRQLDPSVYCDQGRRGGCWPSCQCGDIPGGKIGKFMKQKAQVGNTKEISMVIMPEKG